MTIPANNRRSRRFTYEFRDEVRQAASGNWHEVLQQCGVDGRFLKNSHGPCPGCGGDNRFRFDNQEGRGTFICNQRTPKAGDGFDLLGHVHGWSFPDALHHVAELLGIDPSRRRGRLNASIQSLQRSSVASEPITEDQPLPATDPVALRRIVGIHSGCGPITAGGAVLRYLRGRRLLRIEDDLPLDLLQHPGLGYYEGTPELVGTFPAMVARVRNLSGELVGVHITYVCEGKKAVVANPKKMRALHKSALRGSAVRLYEATDRLAIAEGIENALAVRLATRWPTWAATNATLLAQMRLPASVREVAIWADHDDAGLAAAAALERRLISERRSVRVHRPPKPGMDPLDWLVDEKGEAA
jgi:putative DNA primase/helicase